jgi:hypothetical protein
MALLWLALSKGHSTLKEVQRYTSASDRKRMAREAMRKLVEGGGEQTFVQPGDEAGQFARQAIDT